MTTGGSFSDHHEGALKKQPAVLVTDCESLHDAVHKEGAAPSSTDKRLAIELATVNSRATEGEADVRWIDARYEIADCLAEHASRKTEGVLQALWRITAEETMLETGREEREREAEKVWSGSE